MAILQHGPTLVRNGSTLMFTGQYLELVLVEWELFQMQYVCLCCVCVLTDRWAVTALNHRRPTALQMALAHLRFRTLQLPIHQQLVIQA